MSTTADDDETTLEVTDRASDYLTTLDRMVNLTFIADAKAAPILAAHATVAAVTTTQLNELVSQGSAGQGSLLYFADIANMGQKDFVARSLASSADDLARDALEQTYVVAGIAATKFRRVRLALLLMIGAALAWLALMALANY